MKIKRKLAAKRTTADCLRRAAEIVQWSVDVQPLVSAEQLAESSEVCRALLRAARRYDSPRRRARRKLA